MTKKTTTTHQTSLPVPRRRERKTGKQETLQRTPSISGKALVPIQLPTQPPTYEEKLFLALHSALHAEGGYKRWRLEDFPELAADAFAWEAKHLCTTMIALAKEAHGDFAARFRTVITARGKQLEEIMCNTLALGLQCQKVLAAIGKGRARTARRTLRSERKRYRVEAPISHSVTISVLES